MASFIVAYDLVANAEGGYQSIPQDSGNYNSLGQLVGTNWGISAPVYEGWLGYPPSMADMQQMSRETAKKIFKSRFWDDIQGDRITNQDVANILFDGRVNHGRTGVKIIQRVLNIPDDGIVGDITLSAINQASPQWLFEAYKTARRDYYHQIVANRPEQSIFLQGWLNRINSFEFTSIAGTGILGLLFVGWLSKQLGLW